MATWHQQQNPVKLYHKDHWSVITEAANGQAVMRFCSYKEAETYRDNVVAKNPGTRAYILAPEKL